MNKLRRRCYHCEHVYTVGVDISWRSCPFASEIHCDDTPVWHCKDCDEVCTDEI